MRVRRLTRFVLAAFAPSLVAACSDDAAPPDGDEASKDLVWILDNTESIGGVTPMVLGEPTVTDGALCFDGVDDALVFPVNPLEGLAAFTVEVRFRPDATGAAEQRFVHMQETGAPNRALIETRVSTDGTFHLDTYLRSGTSELTLIDPAKTHPTDAWHWAALSYDGGTQRHFVDAAEELSGAVTFAPLGAGQMSVGTRINLVDWYKGCASELRFHDRALPADALGRD